MNVWELLTCMKDWICALIEYTYSLILASEKEKTRAATMAEAVVLVEW